MEEAFTFIHMWLTFAIIATAITLYATEKLSVEVVSIGSIVLLLLVFQIIPQQADTPLSSRDLLAGFAHPALIAILSLMVIGQGMSQTAALDAPATLLLRYGRRRPKLLFLVCLLLVMALSAFLNDTPVVVMFLPIMIVLANKLNEAPGQVLMPLSFAAILGGMTTLIGTSTNLLVAGSFQSMTGETIGFFEFTPPALVLALTGFLYLWLAAPLLLKPQSRTSRATAKHHGRQFIVQFRISADHPHIGQPALAGVPQGFDGMTIRFIERRGQLHQPPFENETLQAGDRVVVALTRERLHDMVGGAQGLWLEGHNEQPDADTGNGPDTTHLFEVMVPPGSELEGSTLREAGTSLHGGSTIVGIQRNSRLSGTGLHDARLEAGDILLVCGSSRETRALRGNRDVVLMEWSGHTVPVRRRKTVARTLFIGTIIASASGAVPIVVAAVTGAFLMVVTGCLTIRQAAHAINRRIWLLVAGAMAMGTAMEASGGAAWLAHSILVLLDGASPAMILSVLFILVALVSNVLSNNTTAILFTPIVVDMAIELGLPALPFAVTVIFAANCSFATPVSYQTNLLVMGPGGYRFADYLKFGLPLVLILWVAFTLVVPAWYGF